MNCPGMLSDIRTTTRVSSLRGSPWNERLCDVFILGMCLCIETHVQCLSALLLQEFWLHALKFVLFESSANSIAATRFQVLRMWNGRCSVCRFQILSQQLWFCSVDSLNRPGSHLSDYIHGPTNTEDCLIMTNAHDRVHSQSAASTGSIWTGNPPNWWGSCSAFTLSGRCLYFRFWVLNEAFIGSINMKWAFWLNKLRFIEVSRSTFPLILKRMKKLFHSLEQCSGEFRMSELPKFELCCEPFVVHLCF